MHRVLALSVLMTFFIGCNSWSSTVEAGGITIYEHLDFASDLGPFTAVKGGSIELTSDAVSGDAMRIRPQQRFGGAQIAIGVKGSRDLKLAFLALGQDISHVYLNAFDKVEKDNTTSYAPRLLTQDRWIPVVYYLDDFRYNSQRQGTVSPETDYANLHFFVSEPSAEAELILDNFVLYRGEDTEAPARVENLNARQTPEGVRIDWAAATDNVGPMGYVVSRQLEGSAGFEKVAQPHVPYWVDSGAAAGSATYRVLAFDFEGNLGPWSRTVSVSLQGVNGHASLDRSGESREIMDRKLYSNRVREVHSAGRGRVDKGKVCFFGDSLTHASNYSRFGQAALGIYRMSARGFQGAKISSGRAQVQRILDSENPEYLLVLFGTNNLRNRRVPFEADLSEWMADMEAIARAGHDNGTVVLFGTVPPIGFSDLKSEPESRFNEALIDLGRRIGVPVARIFEEVESYGDRKRFLAGDGIHWRRDGMAAAADAWQKAMHQVEWALRDRK